MNRSFAFVLLFLCSIVLGSVSYHFEESNLVISLPEEECDSIKITLLNTTFVVSDNEVKVPWEKDLNIVINVTPVLNGKEKETVQLEVNASRDLPPKISLKIPKVLSLRKLQIPLQIVDDWDSFEDLEFEIQLDGSELPLKGRFIELDGFLMREGNHTLRVSCTDSSSNTVQETYLFTLSSAVPKAPALSATDFKVLTTNDHRVYYFSEGKLLVSTIRGSNLPTRSVMLISDVNEAGNEGPVSLVYREPDYLPTDVRSHIISLESCVLSASAQTVVGKVVLPVDSFVVIKRGTRVNVPENCSVIVRGTLVVEPGARVQGNGQIVVSDGGALVVKGATLDVSVITNGTCVLWLENQNLHAGQITISKALAVGLKNVSVDCLGVESVDRMWITNCQIGSLSVNDICQFMITDSQLSSLNISQFSRGRIVNSVIYSKELALKVGKMSYLELVDCWLSGGTCLQIHDFSFLKIRRSQLNGDIGILAKNYSVIKSFAAVISAETAISLEDSKAVLLSSPVMGDVIKLGVSEVSM